jgi:hypothetical protein
MATYHYVNPGLGTGSNNGTSWANAWKTFADISWATLASDAASQPAYLYVKKGSTSTSGLAVGGSGTSDTNRIIVTTEPADSGAKPIIQDASNPVNVGSYDYITIQNLEITGMSSAGGNGSGVYIASDADYVTIDSCNIHDIRLYGVKVVDAGTSTHVTISNNTITMIFPSVGNYVYKGISMGARYYTILNNTISHIAGDAIGDAWGVNSIIDGNDISYVGENDNNGSTACADSHPDGLEQYGSDGNVIRNNYFHDLPSGGIQFEDAKNMTLYNNVFANVGAGNGPVDLYHGAGTGATGYLYIYNNTFYGNTNQAVNIASNADYSSVIIKGNNFYATSGNGAVGIPANLTSITVMDYNNLHTANNWGGTSYTSLATWQAASGQDAHSVWGVDPVYTSSTNYHLTVSSPSSVTNGGWNGEAVFTTDKDGVTRTVPWSMGAYEYGSSSSTSIRIRII